MNMKALWTTATFAVLMMSGAVIAKPEGKTLAQEVKSNANRFARVDANGDGQLDAAETLAERTRIATRDGKPVSGAKGGAYGLDNDSNGDGLISLEKSETFVKARFASEDANADGVVTEEEKANAKKK
jgi:EF hand